MLTLLFLLAVWHFSRNLKMKYKLMFISFMLFVMYLMVTFGLKHKPSGKKEELLNLKEKFEKVEKIKNIEVKPEEIKRLEPEFIVWKPIRTVTNVSKVLRDIDSHLTLGQYYDKNKVTWAHEGTHFINANIRNSHKDFTKVNGFYCLGDRGCVIYEPRTTIRSFAGIIPEGLRGPSYNLYLVQQTGGWNDRPLYLFDEWVAYTNGSEVGRELNHQGWYFELLQAHNFNVYCMYLAMHVKKVCPDYDDFQMKMFMMWNIERTFRLSEKFDKSREVMGEEVFYIYGPLGKAMHDHLLLDGYGDDGNPIDEALRYVDKVRTLREAEQLRVFARGYFGAEWCKRIYGF